jgi:ferredoxin
MLAEARRKVMKKAQIVYFSGTGGTARVSAEFAKSLISHQVEAQIIPLDLQEFDYRSFAAPSEQSADVDLLILLFPVHAFDAPEPVYEWLSTIPDGNGQAVAVISVSGGGEVWPNTACRAGCIKIFEQKGYDVIYERMFMMPSNVFSATQEQLALRLLQVLPSKAENCVSEILSGVRRRKRAPLTSRIMAASAKLEKKSVRKLAQKYFQVNEKCTGCGWCAKACPRKNIEMMAARPSFGEQCVACLRCTYGCPAKAIQMRKFKFFLLKEGFNLDELEKSLSNSELAPREENIKAGFLFGGVHDYLSGKQ